MKSFYNLESGEFRSLGPTLILSAVAHLVLFLIIASLSSYQPARKHASSVINVNLVSFPGKAPASRPESKAPVKAKPKGYKPKQVQREEPKQTVTPSQPKVQSQPENRPSDAVSVAPVQKPTKTALKSKTYKPSTIVKNAIKRIETDAEQSRPRMIQQAIESLKTKVENQKEPVQSQTVDEGSNLPEQVGPPGEEGGGNATAALTLMDIYKLELTYYIEKNWAFSEQMAGVNTLLEAVLVIKIMPDGQINDIWFEKKSGNGYFDDSVYKAVVKSDPLPPLPKGFNRPYFNVGLIFTPSGLK